MRIDKAHFTVAEVLERWRMPLADLTYLAENAKIRLSVRAFGVPIEFGDVEETPEGWQFRVPGRTVRYDGLLDLHPRDAFPIGTAVEAAGNGVTSVAVRLDGVATAAA